MWGGEMVGGEMAGGEVSSIPKKYVFRIIIMFMYNAWFINLNTSQRYFLCFLQM